MLLISFHSELTVYMDMRQLILKKIYITIGSPSFYEAQRKLSESDIYLTKQSSIQPIQVKVKISITAEELS